MRSDTVTKGMQQAPHRSLFNALGYTEEEVESWKNDWNPYIVEYLANNAKTTRGYCLFIQ